MAKRILTEAQKEARRARAKKRREARKAAAAAGTPIEKKPRTKKTREPKPVEVLPEVLTQVTSATTEDDLIAPRKAKKSRKTAKSADLAGLAERKQNVVLESIDSVKEHEFHRFSDKDEYKSVGYMVKTPTGSSILRGLFCKINPDGKIDKSEYGKLEKVQDESGFLGFVKDWSLAKTDAC